jgi:hypothetical protein
METSSLRTSKIMHPETSTKLYDHEFDFWEESDHRQGLTSFGMKGFRPFGNCL